MFPKKDLTELYAPEIFSFITFQIFWNQVETAVQASFTLVVMVVRILPKKVVTEFHAPVSFSTIVFQMFWNQVETAVHASEHTLPISCAIGVNHCTIAFHMSVTILTIRSLISPKILEIVVHIVVQTVDTAVEMNLENDLGTPVPDYVEENVSTKVVKIIQSYTGVVDKMVWRKNI